MDTLAKQVDKSAYRAERYGKEDRFVSYAHQLAEITKLKPQSVLEIGVGDKVMGNHLKTNSNIAYTSADIADDVGADVVASITKLPFEDNSFDVVCAFEVMEHLPFEKFETSLSELARVSKGDVLVSLPHFGPPVKFLLKLPFLPEIKFAFKIPYPREHQFDGQHYWEIGKRGFSRAKIRAHIRKHFDIVREYVSFGNQYHRFFVLTKHI